LIDFARTDSITFPNSISGTGGIEAQDGGTITLTGTNTYSGLTNVTGATFIAGSTSAFGNGMSALSLASGGTINLNGFSNTVGSIVGNAGTFIDLGSGTITTGEAGGTNIYGGIISGTGGLDVAAPGNVVLEGANTYTGPTSIATGARLELGFVDGTTGSIADSSGVSGGGTLEYDLSNANTFAGTLSGALSVVQAGSGTTTLSGANSYSGTTSVTAGTLADGIANAFSSLSATQVASGATLNVNYNETVGDLENYSGSGGSVNLAPGTTLTIDVGNGALAPFLGTISGSGALVINTNLSLNLSQGLAGANNYSGGTTVLNGELFVGSNSAVGTGTLTFDNGTELSPSANVTLANSMVLNGTGYIDNDDGGSNNLTLTGQISGTNGIAWCTWSTLALTGNNTFQYGIDMRDGMLLLGSDTAAGTGTILLDTGTILAAYGGPGVVRTVPNDLSLVGSSAQLGYGDDNNLILNGAISGESSIAYDGGSSGTLTLNGASNGFSGPFTISSGTVIAGNNNSFGSSGNTVNLTGGAAMNVEAGVTINNPLSLSGAANTLAGSGTIGSAVTVDGTAIISPSASPGNGPGNLTFTGGLTLASGGAIHFSLYDADGAPGTGYSLITADGGLSLTASPNGITFNLVSVNSSGNPASAINFNPSSSYSWMFATSSSAISGFSPNQFNLVLLGFSNPTNGGTFSFSENGNGLYLNFTPVPEPSTWALLGIGLLAVVPFAVRPKSLIRRAP